MKKTIIFISILVLTLISGCEIDDILNDPGDTRDKIEYTYQAEDKQIQRSALSIYYVDIVKHYEDSTKVLLYNFHLLGEDIYVAGTYKNNKILLNDATTQDGYTINGTGIVSSNYKVIEWEYSVNYGDGTSDYFQATFTRVE